MSDFSAPVDLAHTPDFGLGEVIVRPSTREVAGAAGGAAEVLEPRVMQVLVALHRAGGAIVSRDDLSLSCWDGRVVGEDAINRVISRLRRTAETTGAFRIETVTKVGYRLVRREKGAAVPGPTPDAATDAPPPASSAGRPGRRAILVGGAIAATAAIAGGLGWSRWHRTAVPPRVVNLMTQAQVALEQDSADGEAQAIGLLRRVTAIAPDYADGWGSLALAYASASHRVVLAERPALAQRAADAAARAETLDSANSYAHAARATLPPHRGHWLASERALTRAIADHPDDPALPGTLGLVLADVGRWRDAATLLVSATRATEPSPATLYQRTVALWSAGRLDEADQADDEMFGLFPRHVGVWFTRLYHLLYSGRGAQAIAMLDARQGWPPGIPDGDFTLVRAGAQAVVSRAPADIETAMRLNLDAARRGAGYAGNALHFAAALGRIDDAFRIAEAMYCGRGFALDPLFFSAQQASYTAPGDRFTSGLFAVPTEPMRRDPRFAALVTAIGLDRYWRDSGHPPDFRRG